jgi:GT2 family glycosyltransferase
MVLSIIIVNWNTKDLLLQCLESVYQTIEGIETEVFVVDNGSMDGSGSIFASGERFPEVKFIGNEMNLGFARANNQALRKAKGKYVLLLNPDTQVKEEAIYRLVSFMEAHPEAGGAGAQLLNADGSKQNSIANFPSLVTELFNKSLLRWLFPKAFPGKERNYPEPVEVDSVIGACMMVKREAVDQVGLFDEDYFLFLEETDWCCRVKRAGWKIYHVPQSEVYHFQGKGAELEKAKAKVEYYRSRYHFFEKNRGSLHWFILLIGLVAKLMFNLVLTGFLCLLTFVRVEKWRRRFSVYAYLMWWHLKRCPKGMGLRSMGIEQTA